MNLQTGELQYDDLVYSGQVQFGGVDLLWAPEGAELRKIRYYPKRATLWYRADEPVLVDSLTEEK